MNKNIYMGKKAAAIAAGIMLLAGCGNESTRTKDNKNTMPVDTVRVVGLFPYSFNPYGETAYYVHAMDMGGEYISFPVISQEIAAHAVQNMDTIVVSGKNYKQAKMFDVFIKDNLSFQKRLAKEKQR